MQETIGKVILNLDDYHGTDTYSDGDIEERLLEIVKGCETKEALLDQLTEEDDWALLYHLSPIRHNLLEWYDFHKGETLLEIGAGCGAVTGLFCQKGMKVTAIDLSKRRSTINAYRNRQYESLEIRVGNFEDITLTEKYDYVSLIGVLEYAIYYISSPEPFKDMLKKAKALLKPGGKLLLAIENKYGLKYWAGASEDHTGRAFDGIEGYEGVQRVRTFSRDGLKELLTEAGYTSTAFYYPVPDYKMPTEIYSEDYLPRKGSIKTMSPNYDRERMVLFNEVRAYDTLCDDGLYEQFANSFLVIAE